MTLHVVMGDGEMTRKELHASLEDLWRKNEEDGDGNFWFLIQGKSDPTDTDKALTAWLQGNDLFYAIVTDDKASLNGTYASAAQTFTAKNLTEKVCELIASEPDDDETVDILALFASDDPDAEEDRWLTDMMTEIYENGHRIRVLNDGLTELDFEPDDDEPALHLVPEVAEIRGSGDSENEEPQVTELRVEEIEETADEESPIPAYDRASLEALDLEAVKKIANERGIDLPVRTRKMTYIAALLGEESDIPEAYLEETPAATHVGVAVAEAVEALLWSFEHFFHIDSANAKMHLAPVKFSPITFRLNIVLLDLWSAGEDITAEMAEVRNHQNQYELDPGR